MSERQRKFGIAGVSAAIAGATGALPVLAAAIVSIGSIASAIVVYPSAA